MKMTKLISYTASAFLMLNAGTALAADWGGFYAGGSTESNSGDYHDYSTPNAFIGTTYGLSDTSASAFGGYLFDTGSYVFGGEISTMLGGNTASTAPLAPRNADYVGPVTDFKARAGVEFGNALFYGVAGASMSNFSGYGVDVLVSGATYGVGIDFQVTPTYFVGVEYLNRSMTGVLQGPDDVDINLESIAIRIGYLF